MGSARGEPNASLPPIILLVEDELDVLQMYASHFEFEGIWVATARDPAEGMSAVRDLHPDLVISDIGFPSGPEDGVDFVRALKADPSTRAIPLIVLTGLASSELPVLVQRDADLFLRKPMPPEDLLGNVRDLLNGHTQVEQRFKQARVRAADLAQEAARLETLSRASSSPRCPGCAHQLKWIDSARVGGAVYDYFDWCTHGCGLYCFARDRGTWVKLA